MFCPKCKCEYRDGFYECSDCAVSLVAELPEETPREYQFVKVKESCNPAEISYLQSLLDAEGIPFHVSGGFMGGPGAPYRGYMTAILVADYEYDRALEIIADLKWNEK